MENLYVAPPEFSQFVKIQDINGNLIDVNVWTNQMTARGVAIIDEKCSFVIDLEQRGLMDFFEYRTFENERETAYFPENLYNGYSETQIWHSEVNETNTAYALGYCKSKPDSYIPSCGELITMLKYTEEINVALTKCGGQTIPIGCGWWSSNLRYCDDLGPDDGYDRVIYCVITDMNNKPVDISDSYYPKHVRLFYQINK